MISNYAFVRAAALVALLAGIAVACSFGPDTYNGPEPFPTPDAAAADSGDDGGGDDGSGDDGSGDDGSGDDGSGDDGSGDDAPSGDSAVDSGKSADAHEGG